MLDKNPSQLFSAKCKISKDKEERKQRNKTNLTLQLQQRLETN